MTHYLVRLFDYGPFWTFVLFLIVLALCIRLARKEAREDG